MKRMHTFYMKNKRLACISEKKSHKSQKRDHKCCKDVFN